ncbi:TPA: zinc ABC transporter ATP-binding protein [Candidatus Uhrbacteria bacterium]|nr:zinc ABC transporter ATP-binding protein [Candidatus Uhrbacteria bacterium]
MISVESPDAAHISTLCFQMPRQSATTSKKTPALMVEHCSVCYGESVIIDDVSFSVEEGEIAAMIGPNGSGKTTLMRTILGLTPLKQGEILLFGKHLHQVRPLIGYVPQRFMFDRDFPITIREFLDLSRHYACPESRMLEKIHEVGLGTEILKKRLGMLSGGQLQRVLIAQAILNNPRILFLDEPSTGIDISGEAAFYDVIEHLNKEHGTTIILVSHDIAVISDLVDRVICINKHLLCHGPPKTALTPKKLTEVFGKRAEVYEHHAHQHKHHHL